MATIHRCTVCGKTFGQGFTLNRHVREKHTEMPCQHCPMKLYGSQAYEKHVKTHGVKSGFECSTCGKMINRKGNCARHQRSCTGGATSTVAAGTKRPFTLLNPEVTFECSIQVNIQTHTMR